MRSRSVLTAFSALLLLAGAVANASEETVAANVPLYDDLGPLEHPVATDSSEAQAASKRRRILTALSPSPIGLVLPCRV